MGYGILGAGLIAGVIGAAAGSYAVRNFSTQSEQWQQTMLEVSDKLILATEAIPGERMAKMLHYAHAGTDEEKQRARATARALFGFDIEEEYEVSVAFEFDNSKPLHASIRFSSINERDELVQAAMADATSLNLTLVNNRLSPPLTEQQQIDQTRALVTDAIAQIFPERCEPSGYADIRVCVNDLPKPYTEGRSQRAITRLTSAIVDMGKVRPNPQTNEVAFTKPWSISNNPYLTILVDANDFEEHKNDNSGAGIVARYWVHKRGNSDQVIAGQVLREIKANKFRTTADRQEKKSVRFYERELLWASINLRDEYVDPNKLRQFFESTKTLEKIRQDAANGVDTTKAEKSWWKS